MAVTLTFEDDENLFEVASVLAVISAKLEDGENIPELAGLLMVASMRIAAVMANAYERAVEASGSYN